MMDYGDWTCQKCGSRVPGDENLMRQPCFVCGSTLDDWKTPPAVPSPVVPKQVCVWTARQSGWVTTSCGQGTLDRDARIVYCKFCGLSVRMIEPPLFGAR